MFFTDDVGDQVRPRGVLAVRQDGGDGRGGAREGRAEEEDQCRAVGRWSLSHSPHPRLVTIIIPLEDIASLSRII